jgi:hypothetical protein
MFKDEELGATMGATAKIVRIQSQFFQQLVASKW